MKTIIPSNSKIALFRCFSITKSKILRRTIELLNAEADIGVPVFHRESLIGLRIVLCTERTNSERNGFQTDKRRGVDYTLEGV